MVPLCNDADRVECNDADHGRGHPDLRVHPGLFPLAAGFVRGYCLRASRAGDGDPHDQAMGEAIEREDSDKACKHLNQIPKRFSKSFGAPGMSVLFPRRRFREFPKGKYVERDSETSVQLQEISSKVYVYRTRLRPKRRRFRLPRGKTSMRYCRRLNAPCLLKYSAWVALQLAL